MHSSRRHKKKSHGGQRAKGIFRYYLAAAGICAVVYQFINQSAPVGKIVENTLLFSVPVLLVLLTLQVVLKRAITDGPLKRGEHRG